jgi:hypothetical protein
VENVERTQFVVLTGHLDENPLPELIRRLRVQRKSGRLRVEYADGPGSFFFEEGQMVDAHLGELRGVEALYAALELPNASFNFNPLVRPPERNIDRQGQQFIRDLVEAPRREGLSEIRVAGGAAAGPAPLPPQAAPLQLPPAAEELLAPLEGRLSSVEVAIATASRRFSRERLVYAVVIGFLVGLSFVTTLSIIFDPFGPKRIASEAPAQAAPARPAVEVAPPAPRGEASQAGNPNANGGATAEAPPVPAAAAVIGSRRFDAAPAPRREYVVEVLVEVKGGQVTDARVVNPRPGAGAYEAVAVKMARERRYPEGFTGGERLRIKVKP